MMFEHLATVIEQHAAIEQLAAAGVHQPTALDAIVGGADALVDGAARCGGDLLAAYKHSLATHFQATTCIQSFVLVGLGDAIAQAIKGGGAGYDAQRTAKMAALGLLVSGFGTSNWLMFLEGQLPGHEHWQTVVEKASLDAGIWAPAANTAYLFLVPLLDGESTDDAVEAVQKDFLPVMRTEVSTFLPYNLVSFALIPPQFRPFTTGFVSMCFAVYMSWVCNAAKDGDEAAAVVGAEL